MDHIAVVRDSLAQHYGQQVYTYGGTGLWSLAAGSVYVEEAPFAGTFLLNTTSTTTTITPKQEQNRVRRKGYKKRKKERKKEQAKEQVKQVKEQINELVIKQVSHQFNIYAELKALEVKKPIRPEPVKRPITSATAADKSVVHETAWTISHFFGTYFYERSAALDKSLISIYGTDRIRTARRGWLDDISALETDTKEYATHLQNFIDIFDKLAEWELKVGPVHQQIAGIKPQVRIQSYLLPNVQDYRDANIRLQMKLKGLLVGFRTTIGEKSRIAYGENLWELDVTIKLLIIGEMRQLQSVPPLRSSERIGTTILCLKDMIQAMEPMVRTVIATHPSHVDSESWNKIANWELEYSTEFELTEIGKILIIQYLRFLSDPTLYQVQRGDLRTDSPDWQRIRYTYTSVTRLMSVIANTDQQDEGINYTGWVVNPARMEEIRLGKRVVNIPEPIITSTYSDAIMFRASVSQAIVNNPHSMQLLTNYESHITDIPTLVEFTGVVVQSMWSMSIAQRPLPEQTALQTLTALADISATDSISPQLSQLCTSLATDLHQLGTVNDAFVGCANNIFTAFYSGPLKVGERKSVDSVMSEEQLTQDLSTLTDKIQKISSRGYEQWAIYFDNYFRIPFYEIGISISKSPLMSGLVILTSGSLGYWTAGTFTSGAVTGILLYTSMFYGQTLNAIQIGIVYFSIVLFLMLINRLYPVAEKPSLARYFLKEMFRIYHKLPPPPAASSSTATATATVAPVTAALNIIEHAVEEHQQSISPHTAHQVLTEVKECLVAAAATDDDDTIAIPIAYSIPENDRIIQSQKHKTDVIVQTTIKVLSTILPLFKKEEKSGGAQEQQLAILIAFLLQC